MNKFYLGSYVQKPYQPKGLRKNWEYEEEEKICELI